MSWEGRDPRRDEDEPDPRVRLNLGCGGQPIAGYTNIDLYEPADIVGDFTTMEFTGVDEVVMYHVLEHISWRKAPDTIRLIRSWLRPGGKFVVEVPDMEKIMARGAYMNDWLPYVYGCQDNDGEFHKAGYTLEMLYQLVAGCGFNVTDATQFKSGNSVRGGMPCILVVAVRP